MSDFIIILKNAQRDARSKIFVDDPEAIQVIDNALKAYGARLQGIRLPSGINGFVLRTDNGHLLPNSSEIIDQVMFEYPDLVDSAFAPPKTIALTPGGSIH